MEIDYPLNDAASQKAFVKQWDEWKQRGLMSKEIAAFMNEREQVRPQVEDGDAFNNWTYFTWTIGVSLGIFKPPLQQNNSTPSSSPYYHCHGQYFADEYDNDAGSDSDYDDGENHSHNHCNGNNSLFSVEEKERDGWGGYVLSFLGGMTFSSLLWMLALKRR